jgi:hypothetical protein
VWSLVEAVEQRVRVGVSRLRCELSGRHLEIRADDRIDEQMFVAIDGFVFGGLSRVCRLVGDAACPFARATSLSCSPVEPPNAARQ